MKKLLWLGIHLGYLYLKRFKFTFEINFDKWQTKLVHVDVICFE